MANRVKVAVTRGGTVVRPGKATQEQVSPVGESGRRGGADAAQGARRGSRGHAAKPEPLELTPLTSDGAALEIASSGVLPRKRIRTDDSSQVKFSDAAEPYIVDAETGVATAKQKGRPLYEKSSGGRTASAGTRSTGARKHLSVGREVSPRGRAGAATTGKKGTGKSTVIAGVPGLLSTPQGKKVDVAPKSSHVSKDSGFGDDTRSKERAGPPGTARKTPTVGVVKPVKGDGAKWKEKPWILIKAPIAKAQLLCWEFRGRESLSGLGQFEVIAASPKPDLRLSKIVGKPVTVGINFGKQKRYFHGYCGHVEQRDPLPKGNDNQYFYKITFYSILWFMQFSKNYRIFQKKSAQDVIKEIFGLLGVKNFKITAQKRGKTKREYCVQYGESDYAFIQRLMEEEGMFYHVEHTKNGHTVVITDHKNYYQPVPLDSEVMVRQEGVSPKGDPAIYEAELHEETVPSQYFLADYNMTVPKTKLTSVSRGKGKGGNIYHFPGGVDAEDQIKKDLMSKTADAWLDGTEVEKSYLSGKSNVPFFEPGKKFKMKGHMRKGANRLFVLTEVIHEAIWSPGKSDAERYTNHYKAIDAKIAYTPPKNMPKTQISGAQTAVVTGPKDEEIHTDKHGRIKVKFFWDQSTEDEKAQDKTTCWIRVAQGMAGSGWGFLFLPRVGQEVLVTFLDGDPNRPLVTGAIYNGVNKPPYKLPDEKTKSTIKTQSYKDKRKKKGFNEFRFEDKAKKEEIYIHAQKDWNTVVEDARDTKVQGGDDTHTILCGHRRVELKAEKDAKNGIKHDKQRGDDTLIIHKGSRIMDILGKGDKTGNYKITIKKGDRIFLIEKGNEYSTLKAGHQKTLLKKGNQMTKLVKGNRTVELVDGFHYTKIKKGSHFTKLTKGDMKTKLMKGDQEIDVLAGDRKLKINGQVQEEINKGYAGKVKKEYKLEVTGNMMIEVKGNIQIKASANMMFDAKANIIMKAGGTFTADAKGAMTFNSGPYTIAAKGPYTMTTTAAGSIIANAPLTLKASGALSAVSQGAISLTAQAAGTFMAQGPIALQGAVVKIN